MSLADLCRRALRHPARETVDDVVDRGLQWLEAALRLTGGAGLLELVGHRAGISASQLEAAVQRARLQLDLSRRHTGWVLTHQLEAAQKQLGAPLPPSLRRFWSIIGAAPSLRVAVEVFTRLDLHVPAFYLDLPKRMARGPGLSAVWNPVMRGGWHAHLDLGEDYPDWFAEADPALQLRATSDWRKLDASSQVMLDPAFAPSLVRLGGRDGEWVHAVTALRDKSGECPVFSGGDEFEGRSFMVGRHVASWLTAELDDMLRATASA